MKYLITKDQTYLNVLFHLKTVTHLFTVLEDESRCFSVFLSALLIYVAINKNTMTYKVDSYVEL